MEARLLEKLIHRYRRDEGSRIDIRTIDICGDDIKINASQGVLGQPVDPMATFYDSGAKEVKDVKKDAKVKKPKPTAKRSTSK